MMLRRYLEQRHINLDSGRSCLALEREYWQALEVLAYEDGWNNWRDFFYMRVLTDKPENISLASQVRRMVTVFLFRLSTKKGSRLAAFF
jgi:predicted DNA-binding ribbon-helix-helix protein